MKSTFYIPFSFILLVFLLQNITVYGGSKPASGCFYPNQCNPGGGRISIERKFTQSKKIQLFDVSTLNLKSTVQNFVKETQSAISITYPDVNTISAAGNTWLEFDGFDNSFNMNIGVANNFSPQVWTLPTNLLTYMYGTSRQDFLNLSSVPVALQIAGANRVTREYFYDDQDRPMKVYEHYNITNATIDHLGTSYDLVSGQDDTFDEPNYKFADIPLDLNDSYTAIEEETDYIANEILTKYEISTDVDAYGTITTPDGTFNCLRMSHLTKKYTRPNASTAYTLVSTINQITFITKEGYYFNANVSATNGTVSVTNVRYRKVVLSSLLAESSDVRISNDSKGVTINTDNDLAHPSAILDIKNDSLGVLIPRIAQANRPNSPAEGLLVYQVDNTAGFYYFDGTSWQMLSTSTPLASIASQNTRMGITNSPLMKGKSKLHRGTAFIKFEQSQNNFEDLMIQIQLEGNCNGLYISKKTREGFEIKELQRGKSNAKFSWSIN
ncbi:hypothetical protein EGI26_15765 [Lacihabitans sp. CCS-44]|uniref:hypothetical protein n=1 Tax=Lacihabitans sp. CCS-44 TaxID=2487331 RepID=UPI0020CCA38C|nr:hypothetical protein [Lacihabitans sp. CCS-44]MCP9756622.1 hypothetical protein [Lacihabitans sp. CCS-44]